MTACVSPCLWIESREGEEDKYEPNNGMWRSDFIRHYYMNGSVDFVVLGTLL
jgi:hypothetical protein